MYCQHCGNKLNDNDKFCDRCGMKVEKDDISSSTDVSPLADPSVEELDTQQTKNKSTSLESSEVTADSSSDESEKAVASATNTDEADAKKNTLKAAVASTRKRSRRKMPLILVVALVLALVSSIAYAAYYVYTQIYLPQQEAAQQAEQQAEEEAQREEAWAEALDIYQTVIGEYQRVKDSTTTDEWGFSTYDQSINEDLEYANTLAFLDYGTENIYYGLADLNSDGSPELLVATSVGEMEIAGKAYSNTATLFGIYTLDSNKQIKIVSTNIWARNSLVYLGDNYFSSYGSGGYDIGVQSIQSWNGNYTESLNNNFTEDDLDISVFDTVVSVSHEYIDMDDRGEPDSLYVITVQTPEGTTKTNVTYEEMYDTISKTLSQYMPEINSEQPVEWTKLP